MLAGRIARIHDYEAVTRLCRRAVGPEDYVLRILSEVINRGGLFLAFADKQLVGMTNFDKCIDGSGWLSMARTDPEWRGRGIAIFLQRHVADYARRRGIRVLRLWTYFRNRSAIRACLKGGFRPVCEASHISATLSRTQKIVRPYSLSSSSDELAESILGSSFLSKMQGYMAYTWHFVQGNAALVRKLVRREEVYSVSDSVFILTKRERWNSKLYSSFTPLSGSVARSLNDIKAAARGLGLDIVGGYVPYDLYILQMAKRLGFRPDSWGKHCLVFEKQLS